MSLKLLVILKLSFFFLFLKECQSQTTTNAILNNSESAYASIMSDSFIISQTASPATSHDFYLEVAPNPCDDLSVTIVTARTDFDATSEFFSITIDGTSLGNCDPGINVGCIPDYTCTSGYSLGREVKEGTQVLINLLPSGMNPGQGCTTYSLYVRVDIQCIVGSLVPTSSPSLTPSTTPSDSPSRSPTRSPSGDPTHSPTIKPTRFPTKAPTLRPTRSPTKSPTKRPTQPPTRPPTHRPSRPPTVSPTRKPSTSPTPSPSKDPSRSPSTSPTQSPTEYWPDPYYFDVYIDIKTGKSLQDVYNNYVSAIELALGKSLEEVSSQFYLFQHRNYLKAIDEFPVISNSNNHNRRLLQSTEMTFWSVVYCEDSTVCGILAGQIETLAFRLAFQRLIATAFEDFTTTVTDSISDDHKTTFDPTKSPTSSPTKKQKFTSDSTNLIGGIFLYLWIGIGFVLLLVISIMIYCCMRQKELEKSRRVAVEAQLEMMKQQKDLMGGVGMEQIMKAIAFMDLSNKLKDDPNSEEAQKVTKMMDPTLLNLIQIQQQQMDNKGMLNTDEVGQSSKAGEDGGGNNNLLVSGNDETDNKINQQYMSDLQAPPSLPPIFNNMPNNIKDQYAVMQFANMSQNTNIPGGEGPQETGYEQYNFNMPGLPLMSENNEGPGNVNSGFGLGPPKFNFSNIGVPNRRVSKFEQGTMNIMQRNSVIAPPTNNRGQRLSVVGYQKGPPRPPPPSSQFSSGLPGMPISENNQFVLPPQPQFEMPEMDMDLLVGNTTPGY